MNTSKVLSVRQLKKQMGYRSSRSALLLTQELEQNGFLRKKTDGGYSMMKDVKEGLSNDPSLNQCGWLDGQMVFLNGSFRAPS